MKKQKILFVGESWHVHHRSQGHDTFTFDYYEEATEYIRAHWWQMIMNLSISLPLGGRDFPQSVEALAQYDIVMFSDVGANTMNLPMNVFIRLNPTPNKLKLLGNTSARAAPLR